MTDQTENADCDSVRWNGAYLFLLTLILNLLTGGNAFAQDDGFTVEFVDARTEVRSIAQAINLLNNPGTLARTVRNSDTLDYAGGVHGEFNSSIDFPYGDNFAVRARREINVIDAGIYTLGVNSDDGVRLIVDGTILINDDVLRSQASSFAFFFFQQAFIPLRYCILKTGELPV